MGGGGGVSYSSILPTVELQASVDVSISTGWARHDFLACRCLEPEFKYMVTLGQLVRIVYLRTNSFHKMKMLCVMLVVRSMCNKRNHTNHFFMGLGVC